METSIDVRKLRALLAAEQISRSEYAQHCRLSRVYVGGILSGRVKPGELAQLRLLRGLRALGLVGEAVARDAD